MDPLQDDLLTLNPNTIEDVRKMYGLDKPGAMDNAVDILEEWIKKQNHFIKKNYDRSYLERSIIINKGSVERSKTRLDRLCTLRTLTPQFFGDFDIRNDFKDFDGILTQILIPKLTKDHLRVSLLRNCGKKFDFTLVLKYFQWAFMFTEYVKNHDYAAGYIIIIDYRETNLIELATKMNLIDLQQGITVLTEAYGVRVQALHIISSSKLVEAIVSMFKRAFSEKIGNRIMVHKDLDSLHQHVPKDVLPKDYGGNDKTLDEIYEDWVEVLSKKENRQYLKEMSEAKTDENLRLATTFNEQYMGMPGTFRRLNVD